MKKSLHGLILKGTRIIVPNSQRQDVFKQIHAGYIGCQNVYTEQTGCILAWFV